MILETLVIESNEIQPRNLLIPNPDNKPYLGLVMAAGQVILHQFFDSYINAAMWSLDNTKWKYE